MTRSPAYLTKRRAGWVLIPLGGLVIGVGLATLLIGSEPISFDQIIAALWGRWTGSPSSLPEESRVILFEIRLPRVLLALGVGAALGVAGGAFQALLRNPLADPYVLGISGGAALGSILALMFLPGLLFGQPLFGFLGAMVSMGVVYRLGRGQSDPAHLVLAGVIISTLLSSVIVLLTAIADQYRWRRITLWLLGDLSSGQPQGALLVMGVTIVSVSILWTQARALNLMMIGEEEAFAIGVETRRVRWIVFVVASLLTAAAVSVGGAIGYVGLVVPHLIRLATGSDNRLVLPASALGGALLVLLADGLARTLVAPRELPTGAITALIGAPTFLFLLLRSRHLRR
ncbi:MAG: FecCD family ABC transporter permease [Blastocatellia bacterium]